MKTQSEGQKAAIAIEIITRAAELTDLTEEQRSFVQLAAVMIVKNEQDSGLKMALDTIGADLVYQIDKIVGYALGAAVEVARKERYAALRAEGKTPCDRCRATGVFGNGGECYGCNGHGHRA